MGNSCAYMELHTWHSGFRIAAGAIHIKTRLLSPYKCKCTEPVNWVPYSMTVRVRQGVSTLCHILGIFWKYQVSHQEVLHPNMTCMTSQDICDAQDLLSQQCGKTEIEIGHNGLAWRPGVQKDIICDAENLLSQQWAKKEERRKSAT